MTTGSSNHLRYWPHNGHLVTPGGTVILREVTLDEAADQFPEATISVRDYN